MFLETKLNMLKKSKIAEVVPGEVEGARSATGSASSPPPK